jgi:tetratricopeptide (TPR) repeat protein
LRLLAVFAWGILLSSGCSLGPTPETYLERGDYVTALRLYEARLREEPGDLEALRGAGACHLALGAPDSARARLEAAWRLDPSDEATLFFLGEAREAVGDLRGALQAYAAYLEQEPEAREVAAHLRVLRRRLVTEEVRRALAVEASLAGSAPSRRILAIPDFANLTGDTLLDPVGKGLAAMLATDLALVESLRVVERLRLQVLLRELQRLPPGPGSADTAGLAAVSRRLGTLLGAGTVLQGSVLAPERGRLRLDADLLASPTGEIWASLDPASGPLEDLLRLEKRLVFSVVEAYGLRLPERTRRRLERLPTRSLQAFLAYCRGLDWEDRGDLQRAAAAYREALRLDPGFLPAREKAETAGARDDLQPRRARMLRTLRRPLLAHRRQRLRRIGSFTGFVRPPERPRPDLQVPPERTVEGSGLGSIRVEGDLP